MKSKYVLLASALLISVSTFAQKDQIKAAEKALKSGNSAEAKSILQQAESLLSSATDAEKAQYFFRRIFRQRDFRKVGRAVIRLRPGAGVGKVAAAVAGAEELAPHPLLPLEQYDPPVRVF